MQSLQFHVRRVETNKENIYNTLNTAQREFVEFVLRNYIDVGVDELDVNKLSTVLTAKYGSIHEAQKLGTPQEIQKLSLSFRKIFIKRQYKFLNKVRL